MSTNRTIIDEYRLQRKGMAVYTPPPGSVIFAGFETRVRNDWGRPSSVQRIAANLESALQIIQGDALIPGSAGIMNRWSKQVFQLPKIQQAVTQLHRVVMVYDEARDPLSHFARVVGRNYLTRLNESQEVLAQRIRDVHETLGDCRYLQIHASQLAEVFEQFSVQLLEYFRHHPLFGKHYRVLLKDFERAPHHRGSYWHSVSTRISSLSRYDEIFMDFGRFLHAVAYAFHQELPLTGLNSMNMYVRDFVEQLKSTSLEVQILGEKTSSVAKHVWVYENDDPEGRFVPLQQARDIFDKCAYDIAIFEPGMQRRLCGSDPVSFDDPKTSRQRGLLCLAMIYRGQRTDHAEVERLCRTPGEKWTSRKTNVNQAVHQFKKMLKDCGCEKLAKRILPPRCCNHRVVFGDGWTSLWVREQREVTVLPVEPKRISSQPIGAFGCSQRIICK